MPAVPTLEVPSHVENSSSQRTSTTRNCCSREAWVAQTPPHAWFWAFLGTCQFPPWKSHLMWQIPLPTRLNKKLFRKCALNRLPNPCKVPHGSHFLSWQVFPEGLMPSCRIQHEWHTCSESPIELWSWNEFRAKATPANLTGERGAVRSWKSLVHKSCIHRCQRIPSKIGTDPSLPL